MKPAEISKIFAGCEQCLICPICGASLMLIENKSLICENNHCFDISAKGYVNFLPNKKQSSGIYTKRLFENRAFVFNTGIYEIVNSTIKDIISLNFKGKQGVNLLDAGCGEGYYAAELARDPRINVFAADIIKDAIIMACKRKAPVKWMVADLVRTPVRAGTMDVVLNVLASANYTEFRRILADGGMIIKIIPGNDYLKEIREILKPGLLNKEYSNEDVAEYFEKHAKIIDVRTLNYKVPVDARLLKHLIEMTPMTGGVCRQEIDAGDISEITINLNILTGKPR